jgi:predicted dehydrogenase
MAHSFVRGVFNNDSLTPMLLAKSCHDMDLLTHLIGKPAEKVASFGSLKYFTKENCPEGAPKYCLDGCPYYKECPYHVLKIYFDEDTDPAYIRQMGVGLDTDKDRRREEISKNRYGKCVFQTDNNVVDNQTVQIQFEDNISVSFTMCGHNGVERRMTKISMTNGEIFYDGTGNTIKTWKFEPLLEDTIKVTAKGSHSGGDRAIMDNFVDAIVSNDKSILLTPIKDSLEGHLLVFAAEESRSTDRVINLREFEESKRDQ